MLPVKIENFSFCREWEKVKGHFTDFESVLLEEIHISFNRVAIIRCQYDLICKMDSRSIRAIVHFEGKSYNIIEIIFEEVGNTRRNIECMEDIETEIIRLNKFIDLKSMIPPKEYKKYGLLYSGYSRYRIKENNNFILDIIGKLSEISNEQLPVGGYPVSIFGMKEITPNRMSSDIMNVYFIDNRIDKV